ncbi:MAG: hypothetical protein K2O24_08575, partial [Muribaculaceae bacterium]|nr:hypothetical protein [Muribaculaceae bacterium]
MNKIFLSCLAAAAALPAFAGIENLNYQAVLRQNDQVLSNKQVELKFYFEQNGQTIYTEDATVTTDEQGLVKWLIGTNESLNGINWNSSDINLKVSVNTGDGFTLITDGAIASVPTALYALRTAATDELEAKIDENYDDLKGSMERVEGDIRNLQGGLDEVGNEIANILQGGYDEKFLEIGADIDRLTGTQEDLVAFVEMANDEFTRLKAQEEENADFFQRASDELSRLGEEAAKIDENYDELKGYTTRNEQAISVLQGQTTELNEAVEGLVQAGYDEKFLEVVADIERLTGTQDDLVAFTEMANDEFTRLKAQEEENADFFQRVSDELSRLGEEAAKIDDNYDELKG